MEGVWAEYQRYGYDTHRLVRDDNWKERGVDHTTIGHMWRLLAKYPDVPDSLVLASGDGHQNEFGQASSRSWRRFWTATNTTRDRHTWPLSIGTTQTTLVYAVRPHRG